MERLGHNTSPTEQIGNPEDSSTPDGSEVSHDLKDFFPAKFSRVLGRQALALIHDGLVTSDSKDQEKLADEHFLAQEFRADLESFYDYEFRKNAKNDKLSQNFIFTQFVKNGGQRGEEMLHLISPEKKHFQSSSQETNNLVDHYEMNDDADSYYDFVDALTTKDEAGNYKVSDEKLEQFTGWYLSEIRGVEKTFRENIPKFEKYYAEAMDCATKRGYLPEICNRLAGRLDPNAGLHQNIKYYLSDRAAVDKHGTAPSGATNRDKDETDAFIIYIAVDKFFARPTESQDEALPAFYTINHELTHALEELQPNSFNNNSSNPFDKTPKETIKSARRIFKEAITEDIGGIISNVHDKASPDDIKPFCENGRTYKNERETMRFLQSEGKIEISPDLFYGAYVDSKTLWTKLKKELKTSFPECKTDRELAEFIIDKFNEIKQKKS